MSDLIQSGPFKGLFMDEVPFVVSQMVFFGMFYAGIVWIGRLTETTEPQTPEEPTRKDWVMVFGVPFGLVAIQQSMFWHFGGGFKAVAKLQIAICLIGIAGGLSMAAFAWFVSFLAKGIAWTWRRI